MVREINELGATLQRQRLESLEATALVHTVLEELDTAVMAFDDSQQLKLVNRAAAELMGRSSESLIGRTAAELRLDELLARDSNAVATMTFTGRSGRFEVRKSVFRQGGRAAHAGDGVGFEPRVARGRAARVAEADSRDRARDQQLAGADQVAGRDVAGHASRANRSRPTKMCSRAFR